MAAPTFVAEYETVVNTTTSPKTLSVTTAVGDVLVMFGLAENRLVTLGTPTGGTGLTWTAQQEVTATPTSDWCTARVWTAVATTAETFTMSIARTGDTGQNWGWICLRWSGSSGIGATSKGNVSGAAPSLALTTTGANSAVCAAFTDWNALATSRTWLTINSSVGTEQMYVNVSGRYTAYANRWNDVGAASAKTTGLSAPAGQKWSGVAVEVLGSSGTQTVSPTGIASGEALGSPVVSPTITVSPTGIASGQALGTPAVAATITVAPTGIASGQALGTPALSGTVTVSPAGVGTGATVGTPVVSPTITVAPTGVASATAVGTPAVSGTVTVNPTGIATDAALGAPSLSGTVTVSPTGIGSAQQVGTPSVSAIFTVAPVGIPTGAAIGIPVVTSSVTVSPTGISSAAAVGSPTASVAIDAHRNLPYELAITWRDRSTELTVLDHDVTIETPPVRDVMVATPMLTVTIDADAPPIGDELIVTLDTGPERGVTISTPPTLSVEINAPAQTLELAP